MQEQQLDFSGKLMALGLFSSNNLVRTANVTGVTFASGLLDQKLARLTVFKRWTHAQMVLKSGVLPAGWISACLALETKYYRKKASNLKSSAEGKKKKTNLLYVRQRPHLPMSRRECGGRIKSSIISDIHTTAQKSLQKTFTYQRPQNISRCLLQTSEL